jgi:hypothetical protein
MYIKENIFGRVIFIKNGHFHYSFSYFLPSNKTTSNLLKQKLSIKKTEFTLTQSPPTILSNLLKSP